MKTKCFLLLLALNLVVVPTRAADAITESFQKALFEEEANQNLDAAIKAYQTVVEATDAQRKLAATAVFRLGECYRKLGQTNAAVAQYQRLLRDYADQTNLVTLSQQNLAGLNAPMETAVVPTLSRAARQEQKRLLEEEIKMVEQQLDGIKKVGGPDALSQGTGFQRVRELLALRRQLAALEGGPTEASGASSPTATDDRDKELRRIQALLKESPDLINAPGKNGETLLQTAAGKGQLDVVQFLLDHGAAVDGIRQGELTPLHFAVCNGHKAVVDLLLRRGAKVDATTKEGVTPLYLAASKGYAQVAKSLIDAGAPVNARTTRQFTRESENLNWKYAVSPGSRPLDGALAQGYSGVTKLLVAAKADLNGPDSQGRPPLFNAVVGGQKAIVELLLKQGADVNVRDENGYTPLHWAAQQGRQELVNVLLAHKADVNAKTTKTTPGWTPPPDSIISLAGSTPLHLAVANGQKTSVEALLAQGAEVNARDDKGETPLLLAAKGKFAEIVSALLVAKADPNLAVTEPLPFVYSGWTPLHFAIMNRDKAVTELLLDRGANSAARIATEYPGTYGGSAARKGTPLLMAVSDDQTELAKLLLEHKADANLASDTRWRALPLAIAKQNASMAEELLKHGADAEALNPDGLPQVTQAAILGSTNLVALLLKYGADVNARTHTSGAYTALHNAVYKSKELVELLLAYKADPNIPQASDGTTPLHGAVSSGNKEILALLLAHKADPNIRNREGLTPLDLAKQRRAAGPLPGIPGPLPGVPGFHTEASAQPAAASTTELAELLRQHGALDDLPRLDHIEVQRFATGFRAVAFQRSTNDFNRFSLLELVAVQFGLLSTAPARAQRNIDPGYGQISIGSPVTFPDFARVVIRRPVASGKRWEERRVDLAAVLKSGDCAGDVWLEWGDVVEIPEADHPINAPWYGLSKNELFLLKECLSRQIQVTVKGQTNKLDLTLGVATKTYPPGTDVGRPVFEVVKGMQFMLMPALYDSKLLLTSSDLSRVTVKRRAPAGGQERQWVFDFWDRQTPPDFWLRDGDVIEVPEK